MDRGPRLVPNHRLKDEIVGNVVRKIGPVAGLIAGPIAGSMSGRTTGPISQSMTGSMFRRIRRVGVGAASLSIAALIATAGVSTADHGLARGERVPIDGVIDLASSALASSSAATSAASSSPAGAEPALTTGRIGLAHVDLMDLHVVRESGVPVAREVLPAAVIEERFMRAAEAGAAWNRWSMYWDLVERSPGEFMWGPVGALVERDRSHGLKTLAILQGVPPFRSDSRASDGLSLELSLRRGGAATRYGDRTAPVPNAPPPRGLFVPIFLDGAGAGTDDPVRAFAVNPGNAWAVFVDAVVERYRPGGMVARRDGWSPEEGVRVWEIGNEPNLEHFWSGTTVEFVRYLEVANLVIKRRDSEATVLHGGIADHPTAMPWFAEFLEALSDSAARSPLPGRYNHYFDATAWHWYSYSDRLRTGPAEVRAALSARGFGPRPLWVTEMGVPIWSEHPGPCWDPRSPWRATTDEQAAYVLQATAEGVAADVAALIHFQAYDDCGNGPSSYDAFGLLRNHRENQCWDPPGHACWAPTDPAFGAPRPAYHAFRVAADALEGASRLWRPAEDPSGWQRILFYRPPNERVSVIWSLRREPLVAEFFGTGPLARVIAPRDGEMVETSMTPVAGRLRIDLPAMTNRNDPGSGGAVMAGHPIVVIETDTAAPFRAEIETLPERSATRFELVASAADGGTGVGAVRLLVSNHPPVSVDDWRFAGDVITWSADPLSGETEISFEGMPGETVYFALLAADRAGNWTSRPEAAQARTSIEGSAPTSRTPGATPSPSAPVPGPSVMPSETFVPPTPNASSTPTSPTWGDLPQKVFLPVAHSS